MSELSTKYLNLEDVRIAYREHGSGPTLILLHGNSGSKRDFSRHQKVDFSMFHTLAVDSRGHGETISNDERLSIEQFSEDVIALCKTMRIDQAAVIGYSDGGNIALLLAKIEPARFTKIVAISPNYLFSGLTGGARRLIGALAKTLRFLKRLGLPVRAAVLRFDLMMDDIGLAAEDLAGIQTEMRILHAERDVVREEHIEEMGRLIPGATIKRIGGCNHLTILSKRETIETIRDFLGEEISQRPGRQTAQ